MGGTGMESEKLERKGKWLLVFFIMVPLHWFLEPKENLGPLYLLKENASLPKNDHYDQPLADT